MEATTVTGPAKNLLAFARWLKSAEGSQCGLSIELATFERHSIERGANGFVNAARVAGVEMHVVRERFRYDFAVRPQLAELIARTTPDIIQTHNSKSHLLISSMSRLRRNRLWLAFHHGDTYTSWKQRAYNELDRLTLRSADAVITVCQAFVPLLMARGVRRDRIRVLHNAAAPIRPVGERERQQLREALAIGSDEAVILSVGRLSREKGQEHLIQAAAQLPPLERPWKLLLVGSGPDRDRLRRLGDALGLTERIAFAGFHADVAPFYAIADVFALPSLTEGSSNVLLEAMSANVPIVATRVGGNAEIALHGETALLVPALDPRSFAAALTRLLSDRDLAAKLSSAGLERARIEFSQSRYLERLGSYYAQALRTAA